MNKQEEPRDRYFYAAIKIAGTGSEYIIHVVNNEIKGFRKLTPHRYEWDVDEPIIGEWWPAYCVRAHNKTYKIMKSVSLQNVELEKLKNKDIEMINADNTNEKNIELLHKTVHEYIPEDKAV